MFEIKKTLSFNKDKLVKGDKYDYITRTSQNQGVLITTGFINEKNLNEEGVWSLGLISMDFFYRKRKWYAGQFIRKIIPKFDLNDNIVPFFTTILNKQKKKFLSILVRDIEKVFLESKIKLPIKNEKIDFEFMEDFIKELEEIKLNQIKNYLKENNLDDLNLTKKEKEALERFENGKIKWGEFKIGDLFEVVGTKSLDSNAVDFVTDGINFVGRTFENNGIQGKIKKQKFEPNEAFTITATVIGNYKYVKYQKKPYYCSQNINKLKPKKLKKWTEKIAYYFVTNIQKFVSSYDGQQGGYKLNDIKNHKIKLPIKDDKIDFEFMENLISAIQKNIIKKLKEKNDS